MKHRRRLSLWRRRSRWTMVIYWVAFFCFQLSLADSEAQETRKIRLGYSAFSLSFLPHLFAKEAGLFQKYNLDVDLVQMAGPLQVAALSSGDLDFGGAISPALFAAVRGLPLKGVMFAVKTPLFYLVSEPKITKVEELSGKKVAVDTIGALQHISAKTMIQRKGVNPDLISYFQTGSVSNSLVALSSGAVSAAVLSIPHNLTMTQKGFHQLSSTQEAQVNFPPSGLTIHQAKLQKEPLLIKRLIGVMLDSMRLIESDRKKGTLYIQQKWKLSPKFAEEAYALVLPTLAENGRMGFEDVQEFLNVAYENNLIQQRASSKALLDYTQLDEVLRERKGR